MRTGITRLRPARRRCQCSHTKCAASLCSLTYPTEDCCVTLVFLLGRATGGFLRTSSVCPLGTPLPVDNTRPREQQQTGLSHVQILASPAPRPHDGQNQQ